MLQLQLFASWVQIKVRNFGSPISILNFFFPPFVLQSAFKVNSPNSSCATDPGPAHNFNHSSSQLKFKKGEVTRIFKANCDMAESKITGHRESSPVGTIAPRAVRGRSPPFSPVKAQSELNSREKIPSIRKRRSGGGDVGSMRMDVCISAHHGNCSDSLKEIESDDGKVIISTKDRNVLQAVAGKAGIDIFNEQDEETIEISSGIGICGMEVTSNNAETTVILKHIHQHCDLISEVQSSFSSFPPFHPHSDMITVEEDSHEEFYESEDIDGHYSSPEIRTPFTLAHLIPQLFITNENGCIVETIVDKATRFNNSGAAGSLCVVALS